MAGDDIVNKEDKRKLRGALDDIAALTDSTLAEHPSPHVWDTTFSPNAEVNSLYAKAVDDAWHILASYFDEELKEEEHG